MFSDTTLNKQGVESTTCEEAVYAEFWGSSQRNAASGRTAAAKRRATKVFVGTDVR
jgi:hypothetical protein